MQGNVAKKVQIKSWVGIRVMKIETAQIHFFGDVFAAVDVIVA